MVPLESEKLTSVAEAQGAVREFRQDWKAKRKGAALEGKERGMAQGRLERGQDTSCKSGANQTLPMKGGDRADGPIFSILDRDSLPGGAPMAGASTSRPDLVSQIQDWLQLPCDSLCLSAVVLNGILGSVDCGLSHLVLHSSGVEEETTAGEKAQRKRDLFPLPLPGKSALQKHVDEKDYARVWLYLVVSGLNYLHAGRHGSVTIGNPSPIQRQILEYLEGRVRVFLKHRFDVERFDWSKFLSTRTLSYGGEEVRTAKWTTWANLEPALPYGAIGKIPAVDLAEGGVLDALRHPEKYLKPGWESTRVRSSRVMVEESQWPELCRGLVRYNLVSIIPHSAVARAGGQLVLNGLFGVEKGELCEGVCVHRLIMNLIPYNSLCLNVEGDVGTLPLLHQMNALQLHPHEDMIISSEDVRCFFYVFSLPESWLPFLTFNKPVPSDLVPPGVDEPCYLAAKVLPMGFLNSVGIAQHLHRNFLSRVQGSPSRVLGYSEIRKDRSFTLSNPAWRVYLDNLDVLEKVSPSLVPLLEGRVSDDVSPLIAAYQQTGIPLNPKKSVNQQSRAEMQGADIDGVEGTGRPKAEKLGKYVSAALSLLRKGSCSQKEIRIVAGGLVYFSMFRRPLMSCLNYVWQFIQSFEEQRVGRLAMPRAVKSELFMFLCLLPLGHFDFRAPCSDIATASDASMLGGGVCASDGVTQFGASVAALPFRGETFHEVPEGGVVCVGLFDGVSGLRVSLEAIRARICLHVSVETNPEARRVVESAFPNVEFVDQVQDITPELCQKWAAKASSAKIVIVGAGPPYQGVSSVDKQDQAEIDGHPFNSLHVYVKPIVRMLEKAFSWTKVHFLQESVFSVSAKDRSAYTKQAEVLPYMIPASGISPTRRDRLYWFDWPLEGSDSILLYPPPNSHSTSYGEVQFKVDLNAVGILEPGWRFHDEVSAFQTFTTAQPSVEPSRYPAGANRCQTHELQRWREDEHRFPPYQYCDRNILWHNTQAPRPASVSERERAMGYPLGYTSNCMPKSEAKSCKRHCETVRLNLVGNSWSVAVVGFLLHQLLAPLKLCLVENLEGLLDTLFRDRPPQGDCLLSWHSLEGISEHRQGMGKNSRTN